MLNFLIIVFLCKELAPGIICIAFRTIILMKLNFNSFWWKLVPVLKLYFAQVEFKCSLVRTGSCTWILIVLRTIILINSVHAKFNYSWVKTSSKFVWLMIFLRFYLRYFEINNKGKLSCTFFYVLLIIWYLASNWAVVESLKIKLCWVIKRLSWVCPSGTLG